MAHFLATTRVGKGVIINHASLIFSFRAVASMQSGLSACITQPSLSVLLLLSSGWTWSPHPPKKTHPPAIERQSWMLYSIHWSRDYSGWARIAARPRRWQAPLFPVAQKRSINSFFHLIFFCFSETSVAFFNEVLNQFIEAYNNKDWDRVSSLYTEDAMLVPGPAPPIKGKAGTSTFFMEFSAPQTQRN